MTESSSPQHSFVFIGGLHRSGTSLLARHLADHPLISGFANTGVPEDEGQLLQSVYPAAKRYGGPGRFGFAPEMHLTERSPLVTDANRRRLFDEWRGHWNCDRPVLLEKSPPNLLKTRFLQAMFPGARFIMMLRHPVANALATQKWSRTSLDSLIEHWLLCYETLARDLPSLEHVTLLRYEDLVVDADDELARLQRFIGVEPLRSGVQFRQDVNASYFRRWRTLGYVRRRLLPTRLLPPSLRRESPERRFEVRANRFGYTFGDLERVVDRDEMLEELIPGRTGAV